MARGELAHGFVQITLIEQQVVGVLQGHIGTDLAQRFQGGDVRLCLVAEEALVNGLAETGSRIDDCLGKRVVGNTPVGGEIVGLAWPP